MYLLDSNVFLELLLDQEHADDVQEFLNGCAAGSLYLSELSLYSIGIILLHRSQQDAFLRFLDDVLLAGSIRLVRLAPEDLRVVAETAGKFALDFDDAYQYVAASKHAYTLVSFDGDFDRTDLKRKLPSELLAT